MGNQIKKILFTKEEIKNRAEQLNPTSEKYWKARGLEKRPLEWEKLVNTDKK
jgi:hypothetical protein